MKFLESVGPVRTYRWSPKIKCITTGEIYTFSEVVEALVRSGISLSKACIRGRLRFAAKHGGTTFNHKWSWVEEEAVAKRSVARSSRIAAYPAAAEAVELVEAYAVETVEAAVETAAIVEAVRNR